MPLTSTSKTKATVRKPKLRFPDFSGAWEEKKLGEVATKPTYGMNAAAKKYDGRNIYLRITDIDENTRLLNRDAFTSPDAKLQDIYKLKEGDLLFARTGASVGKTYLYKSHDGTLYFAGYLIKFSIKDANPYFVYLQTLRQKYFKWVKTISMRSGQPGINANEYSTFKLNIPSLPEQQKIAEFLGSVDNWLENLRNQKQELEAYKKGMMQKLFSQEIRFKDKNGKDFPDWEGKKLGEVAYVTTGSSNREDSIEEGEYTFFDRSEDIRASTQYLFDGEAIIVAGEGQEFKPKYFIGKFDLHQRTYAIMKFENTVGKYLFYYIHYNRKYFNKVAVGSTVQSLRLPMFNKMPMNLPSVDEQQKITEFLTSIDQLIESKQQQITQAEQWKKGLMQGLFV